MTLSCDKAQIVDEFTLCVVRRLGIQHDCVPVQIVYNPSRFVCIRIQRNLPHPKKLKFHAPSNRELAQHLQCD